MQHCDTIRTADINLTLIDRDFEPCLARAFVFYGSHATQRAEVERAIGGVVTVTLKGYHGVVPSVCNL